MRLSIILFLIFISGADCFCQNRNSVWCFGDSAGIDFTNLNNPVPIETGLRTRGSCVSICDTNSNLLLYAYTRAGLPGNTTLVKDKYDSLMQNGDSIVGEGWYSELLIIQAPDSSSLYYLFSISNTGSSQYGFYYSIIDMSLNNGLGVVTQKNIQLQNYPSIDCIIAIKHGNGRDWWVIFKRSSFPFGGTNNEWYKYLVRPNSITYYGMQQIGIPFDGNAAKLCVNSNGNEIAFVHYGGLVETYDFDRCTGIISNQRTIEYPTTAPPYLSCNECAFSPNDNFLYVTTNDTVCSLLQYNLLDINPAATKDTLWFTNFPKYTAGAIRRAPDNKLYLSNAYYDGMNWNYPYPDSVYNIYNMYLGVVNYPDSVGTACDFQPYSFYLGGNRTYWGLPNNPDYDLGRDSGSVCDTIQWTGIQNIEQAKGLMYVTYISAWQKAFLNAQGLKGRSFKMSVYDLLGNVVYKEEGKLSGQYFTKDLNMAAFAKGMYIVNFATDKERLVKKFIKD